MITSATFCMAHLVCLCVGHTGDSPVCPTQRETTQIQTDRQTDRQRDRQADSLRQTDTDHSNVTSLATGRIYALHAGIAA